MAGTGTAIKPVQAPQLINTVKKGSFRLPFH